MSWLFGMGGSGGKDAANFANLPGMIPPPAGSPPGGQGGQPPPGGVPNPNDPNASSRMAYSFDSQALERAAKAAKELEKSPNAKEALALSKTQEETRQLEIKNEMKKMEAMMENSKVEQRRVAEEERRKTISEESQHAKQRMEYQDQLARKRQQDDLAAQRAMQEDSLKKQEESVRRQEEMRRSTIEHELATKHKYDMERVQAETMARAKADRENRDVNIEQLRVREGERRKTVLEGLSSAGSILGAGFQAFISDPKKITATVGGLSLLALGVYTSKRGTGVIAKYAEARLGKPSLVRETSRITLADSVAHPIATTKKVFTKPKDPLEGIVLKPELESRLRDVALTTANTKRNNGLYRNIMFYGPPGTGKSMFAKSLALHSGLDYAILTGGDVAPMGPDGVSAIHKLFDWANTSNKGLLLFVDEADAFLRKRSTEKISEDMRATLNAFLYRTGEQSNKYMLCIASNQPEQFDWAVNDRFDELVNFTLPGLPERNRMLLTYFEKYIAAPAMASGSLGRSKTSRLKLDDFDWVGKCKDVASKTDGLSGREISKLVVSWQAAAYASETGILTPAMIDARVAETMRQHQQKAQWLQDERKLIKKRQADLDEAVKNIEKKEATK